MGIIAQCCEDKVSEDSDVLLTTVSIQLLLYLIFLSKHVAAS